ncbi:MAG: fused MFS/spermidine synthase [Oscillatoria princeps RMCB-10]|nr:fused MFS/spermidine synthase [Oscillatoria princeps RMCB-10]
MLILFSLTLFVSAFLLFWAQLMVAKMILPLLGGSPSVWNTCLFFFQAILLLGYGYGHLTTAWWGARRQAVTHSILLLLPVACLPVAVSKSWVPPQDGSPIPGLLALLLVSAGLPFFVVSTTAPLVQKWFAGTGHPSSQDPYFLYSASNLGSLLGLLSYPTLIEPNFSLTRQSWLWAEGYGLLVLLALGCAVCRWRSPQNSVPDVERRVASLPATQAERENTGPAFVTSVFPFAAGRSQWVLLSFIPSSLLQGVTAYLTADIAAVPLLWAVPLAVYLLTFIVTFARQPLLPHKTVVVLSPFLFASLIVLFLLKVMQPVWLVLPWHLLGLFAAGCAFHGELQRSRPSSHHLTSFYLWVAFGGVLGGLFNAIAAPLLFRSVLEYPLLLSVGMLLLQAFSASAGAPAQLASAQRTSLVILFGVLLFGFQPASLTESLSGNGIALLLVFVIYLGFKLRAKYLVTATALVFLLSQFSLESHSGVMKTERSFFGSYQVVRDRAREAHTLLHGTTVQGRQSFDPQRRREPLTYYHPTGPAGQVFQYFNHTGRLSKIAVLGLGVGSLAAYSTPGQEWTFYEIDPAVEKLARNPNYFTFLQDSKAPLSVVLGDARLRLAERKDNFYDLIVVDVFSSDSIPAHLVTQEALQLYFRKLNQQGLVAIHISNRSINLEPVLGALARHLGLSALRQLQREISPAEREKGKSPSLWVLLARQQGDFGTLASDSRWQPIPKTGGAPLWTDDFSDIFRVLRGFRG